MLVFNVRCDHQDNLSLFEHKLNRNYKELRNKKLNIIAIKEGKKYPLEYKIKNKKDIDVLISLLVKFKMFGPIQDKAYLYLNP